MRIYKEWDWYLDRFGNVHEYQYNETTFRFEWVALKPFTLPMKRDQKVEMPK